MDYIFNWSYPSLKSSFTVPIGTIETGQSSLKISGRGSIDWGRDVQQNILLVLENFASPTSPANPTIGQLWFNTTSNTMKVYGNGLSIIELASSSGNPVLPFQVANPVGAQDAVPFGYADGRYAKLAGLYTQNFQVASPADNNSAIPRGYADGRYAALHGSASNSFSTSSLSVGATLTVTGQITSNVSSGTAPFIVQSTTPVANLNIGGNAATADYATNAGHALIADSAGLLVTSTNSVGVFYPTFVSVSSGAALVSVDLGLTYDPSTNNLTTSTFTGNVTGNITGSSGSCTGNSVTATTATTATNQSGGTVNATSITRASAAGNGITSTSVGSYGILGISDTNNGVQGLSTSGSGNYGGSASGPGSEGFSTSGCGLYGHSSTGPDLLLSTRISAPSTSAVNGSFYCGSNGELYNRAFSTWNRMAVTDIGVNGVGMIVLGYYNDYPYNTGVAPGGTIPGNVLSIITPTSASAYSPGIGTWRNIGSLISTYGQNGDIVCSVFQRIA